MSGTHLNPVAPILVAGICVFCLAHESRGTPCTYGLGHEYPPSTKPKQAAKPDRSRCLKCGLHPKNPFYAAASCAHDHSS